MGGNKRAYYAVARGRNTGIYSTWDEASDQVKGYGGNRYKKFDSYEAAQEFCRTEGSRYSSSSGPYRRSTTSYGYSPYSSSSSNYSARHSDKYRKKISRSYSTEKDIEIFSNDTHEKSIACSDRQVVYADGSSLRNGKKGAVAGCGVFFGNDDPRNISVPLAGEEQTNNRAELQAIILALENTSGDLTIRSDSNYSIKSLTTWLPKWKKNDFKTSNSQPVKNLDLINRASDLMSDRNVSLEYVKGHSTDYGNQQADMLARRGASE
ncbi:ribonuclease H Rnh1 [Schizosaccharomyces pombe]|uniref:Ribonuclease H n=1 Tax=Schizosaccharomyces pombe (strain 972 / ATCC 24843) TaxID=284812 RepID=RNH1_SCHPO|nr:putative ribonuclease H Rnh1 [Schizosaccharomyces pombe]Q9UST8.1 RecName: Full=Ribonuclease H; Short=RNase H [Schizosaccharomyces pombe 972h-]CAB58158.1 ribonuclease H Rnh1 (predicted) [Schizosaccharomyces pombe]|eukprot:NP_596126.1 putative ribonuclease H Rnh1 [Schizosaccharomyces pombe]